MSEWIRDRIPPASGKETTHTNEMPLRLSELTIFDSERVLVVLEMCQDDSPRTAFAKYSHATNSWHVEGFQGNWRVLAWSPIPSLEEFEKKGNV